MPNDLDTLIAHDDHRTPVPDCAWCPPVATVPAGVTSSSEVTPPPARRGRRVLILVLFLVNAAAIWGQAGWALDHIVPAGWGFWPALGLALAFAAAIELIGVFLALSADDAEDRNVPAGGIRLASYAVGLVSGLLNLSHWGWFGAAGLAFGFLSAASPFLWGVHSRVNRVRPVAPSRRFWHPFRSIELIRFMAWEGIASEDEAIRVMTFMTDPADAPTSSGTGLSAVEVGRLAIQMKAEEPTRAWKSIATELRISESYLSRCRKAAES